MSTIEKADHSQDLYSEIGICNNHCRKCVYGVSEKTVLNVCNYIVMTGHRRPCPAGKGCTAFVGKTKKVKKKNN